MTKITAECGQTAKQSQSEAMKVCSKCFMQQPLSDFVRKSGYCRSCRRAYKASLRLAKGITPRFKVLDWHREVEACR